MTTLTSVPTGGVTTREMHLARLMGERGWRVIFGLAWGNRFHNPFHFRELHPDAETVLLDGRTGTRDGRRWALRDALLKVCPDVVMPGALADTFEVMGQFKQEGSRIRMVVGMPGIHDGANAFIRAYRGIVDQSFGVSRFTTGILRTACGIPSARVHYVPTGVAPASRRTELVHDGPIRLGYIGRFDGDKRPMDLIRLCAELDARGVDYRAIAVGPGTLAASLARAAEALSGRLRVLQPMSVSQLYQSIYPELDACLLFSPYEGMPNSLLEAMAHGVVPVTSDFLGRAAEGLIEDGQTGAVFPVGDIGAAADRIVELSNEPTLRLRLGQRALEAVETRHRLDVMGDTFAHVLESALHCEPALERVTPLPGFAPGRLTRWFGPAAAERIRRLYGKRFNHRDDDGEWPRIGKVIPPGTALAPSALEIQTRPGEQEG